MSIDHPRFPTPEDERLASLLYEALRALAEIDDAGSAPGMKKPAEERPAAAYGR